MQIYHSLQVFFSFITGIKMELELNIDDVDSYAKSLGDIADNCNLRYTNDFVNRAYFLRHPRRPRLEDFTLCRHSKRFQELFGNQETTVHIRWDNKTKLLITLNKDSLYVVKIKTCSKDLWKNTERPYTGAITNANGHPHDCFNAHNDCTNRIDLGFWQEIKTTQEKDLEKFFANNHERMFVYVAEAIRFPLLFVSELRNKKPGSFFPIQESWRSHFKEWDTRSKESISRVVFELMFPESRLTLRGGGGQNTNMYAEAEKIVKNSGLVREDKNSNGDQKYLSDVLEVLQKLIRES